MSLGIRLAELVVQGPGKPEARVGFDAGLNVIVGPSDTGKTFIFGCLDYALGATKLPKEIPQAKGYETVRLRAVMPDGREVSIERSLRGGDVRLRETGGEAEELAAKHSGSDARNISSFLLKELGLSGRRIRRDMSGTTRSLSFRDLAHLAFVDEEAVITDGSPVKSGQHLKRTEESRVFNFVLSGEDDSSVIAKEKPAIRKAKRAERRELLEELIAGARASYGGVEAPESVEAARSALETGRITAEQASQALTDIQDEAGAAEERRREAWSELRAFQSRADVHRELQTRFELLQSQYETDLERLASIAEVSLRVDQTPSERCPVCGAMAEHQEHRDALQLPSPEEVRASCEAERTKIATLTADLKATARANEADLARELAGERDRRAALADLDEELAETLRPRVVAASVAFREAEGMVRGAEQALAHARHEDELGRLLAETQKKQPRSAKLPPPKASTGGAEGFTGAVERLLAEWEFPEAGRVTFSEEDEDIVIAGRHRKSFGKGVLALTHAAFSLGLLRHCSDEERPNTGFVAIDSPLVVYREPDPDEGEFPIGVKDKFYRSLAGGFGDAQVFIFENEAPPADIAADANIIRFTKAAAGRYGFIPR